MKRAMEQDVRKEKLKLNVLSETETQEHFHQDFELLYVLEGTLDVKMGDQTVHMESDDIFVVNANKKHTLNGSANLLYMQIMISYPLVSEVFKSIDIIFWCDSTRDKSERYDELRNVLRHLLSHYLETHGDTANFGHIGLCYRVLDLLSMYFLVQTADREEMDDKDKFEDRIAQINNYIRANYNQPISLKDLADKLYLSNGYLSRFFKRNYGMSFAEYLTNIRLFHAVDELLYSNAPITRIAYDNGFTSVAVFNKVFKKAYGETPSAMRKKATEQKEEIQTQNPELEKRLEKYLIMEEEKIDKVEQTGVSQSSHSVLNSEEMKNYMGNTINIGTASELLRSEVQEHVLILKQALGFKYVRFWNLFSKDFLVDLDSEEDYNFSRLDSVFDFLLSIDLKPHIDFGIKSKLILYNAQDVKFYDDREDTYLTIDFVCPKKWGRFLETFMQHLVHRYGRSEIDTWRGEVWFNEGKRQEKYFDKYFELFDITYKTVKKYSEGMEIGGYGARLDLDVSLRRKLLTRWKEEHCYPDFISIYLYHYERGREREDRYAKKSTDNEFFLHQILKTKELLKESGMDQAKLYVTEWNISASVRNYINDGCFKGAFILKNALDLYGLVDEVVYYLGTDRTLEYYDTSDLLFGGCGILTKDGILKPAGFAFEFWKRLYPYCIGRGSNYLLSTDKHDSYGIICHNQRALGYNYFFTKENELEKEHLWKYFEDRNELKLELELTDLPDGTYQIKTYRINEKNGSVIAIWGEMEYEKVLSRNDIKYFKRMCEPKLSIQKMSVRDGKLQLAPELIANEIMFIRIRKIA